jgi:phosphoglycerol transferase MdoB-like AlkP superfamily enzyme
MVSAVYFLVLYVGYSLVLRVANFSILNRAGAASFDFPGPPFSLPFILGEELVIGMILALILGALWRTLIPRTLWIAILGMYLFFLALNQAAFKHYFTHFDYVLFAENHDATRAWSSIIDTLDMVFVIEAGVALVCIALIALPYRPGPIRTLASAVVRHKIRSALFAAAYIAVTVALVMFGEQHGLNRTFPVTYISSYLHVQAEEAEVAQAVTAPPIEIPQTIKKSEPDAGIGTDELASVRAAIRAHTGKLNVVWYLMESTAYRDSSFDPANHYDTTPFLEKLSKDSLLFTNYYPGVAASTRSFFSAMTGFYPFMDKTSDLVKYSQGEVQTLVDILHDDGYATAFFTSSDSLFDSLDSFIATRPYDLFMDKNLLPPEDRPAGMGAYWGVDEEVMIDQALKWIETARDSGKPFYLNYNALYPHHPFRVPDQHRALYDEDWGDYLPRARFRASLRYADMSVQRFYEGLQKLGVADNTLFIVVPDHGEAFGDLHPRNHIHAEYCYEEDSRIFLLLHNRNALGPPLQSARLGSNIDFLPTLLDILGLAADPNVNGRTLISRDRNEPMIFCYSRRQFGVRDGNFKFNVDRGSGKAELYDLSTDPTEQDNIAKDNKEKVATYRKIIKNWRIEVARIYKDRMDATGLTSRDIEKIARRRRAEVFASTRVRLESAAICPGSGRSGCITSGTLSLSHGQSLSGWARVYKSSSARVKLEIYGPDKKRIHAEIKKIKDGREASFSTVPGSTFEAGKNYVVRITSAAYRAIHDTRIIRFHVKD